MPKKKKASKSKKIKSIKKAKSKNKVELKFPAKKTTTAGVDEKPVIVKIKKQASEKRIFNLKDFVV